MIVIKAIAWCLMEALSLNAKPAERVAWGIIIASTAYACWTVFGG